MKKKIISIISSLIFTFAFAHSIFAAEGPRIWEVKASSLNVRSGPGISYPIIATIYQTNDIPEYDYDTRFDAEGYSWRNYCYASSGIGEYRLSIHGWCACYNFNTTTLNCGIPTGSLKVLTNGFNVYSDKYLTNSVGTYSYGTILGPYDDGLTYEYGYPNSWRITTATNTLGTLRYGKGWYLATGNN